MLVRIDVNPPGPLRVIGEIPDARLAILEGYNGVGKTLAIRLLELCTGTMPYALDSPAWSSLREGLGRVRIEMTGLHGADSIVWLADSEQWTPGDPTGPRTDWFRSITIDGKSATLDEVRRLVTVTRFSGDEDLAETFASQAESHAATVQRWAAKYAGPEGGPLKRLEDLAGNAADELFSGVPDDIVRLQTEVDTAEQDHADLQDVANRLHAHRGRLKDALDLRRRVDEVRKQSPNLRREIEEIDELIQERQLQLEQALAQADTLAAQAGRSDSLQRELRNAERTLLRNISNLDRAWTRAAREAAACEVEADAHAARECLGDLERIESDLIARHDEQNKAPAMVQLLADLTDHLLQAGSRGLDDQIAIEDADGAGHLSVSDTRDGMVRRRHTLDKQQPPPEAVEIAQQLESVRSRRAGVETLRATLQEVARYDRLVRTNEDRLRKALQQGAGIETAEAMEQAANRRFECEQALRELAARRAVTAQRLGPSTGPTTERALTRQLAGALDSLGLQETELNSASNAAEAQSAEADAALAVAAETLRERQHKLARAKASVRDAIRVLKSDSRLSWLRSALGPRQPSSDDIIRLHKELLTAREVVDDVLDRLGSHRSQLDAIASALRGVARQLRGQTVDASEYVEQIHEWLGDSFSAWFNDERVRRELLQEADADAQITVNLKTQRVVWTENQVTRSRPLEAFSSGEQAFAYTRARLAVFDDSDTPVRNRLIVLDEFGAFISHHLLEGLLDYLQEWTVPRPSDRLLLILPLSRDYEQMASGAVGARAKQYAQLAKGVAACGYATRIVVP